MQIIFVVLIFILSLPSYAEINTQYPGCSPDGSTPAEVETRPKYFYIPQTPLTKEALDAKAAEKKQ